MGFGRILAVDDDAQVLHLLEQHLTPLGFEVAGVKDATQAVPGAMALQPNLILVDRTLPILNGAEILRALRAFPQTLGIPVAFLTDDPSAATLVRCLRSGAVDVLHKPLGTEHLRRIADLVEELWRKPIRGALTPELRVRSLLRIYRREARVGVLRLNPGTPFEGRAVFDQGGLLNAEFGPARGLDALVEMLDFEDGIWRFDPGLPEETTDRHAIPEAPPPTELVHLAGEQPVRLLLVDDDPDLRRLFKTQLSRAGFVVDLAEDGREGVHLARANEYDLMVADLDMPRLDGWGMLRELHADFRTRELPVIFLSAHDDYRETLRAAKSGAWDYLPKTGRADLVIDRSLQALRPRQSAVTDLLTGSTAGLELGVLGPRWVLRTLAAQKLSGVLEARDEWAQYRIAVREGSPVSARALASKRESTGVDAVAALLTSHGARGRFVPARVEENASFELQMDPLLDVACAALNELDARAVSSRIQQGGRLEIDTELYALYRRVCSDRELLIARAVCEDKVPTHELSAQLSLPPEDVEAGLADLLRRRVVRFD